MIIQRGALLAKLNEARIGLAQKPTTEQSNCFAFAGGKLTAYNGEIMCRLPNPLDFDAVVNATDLIEILAKIPDEDIEITLRGDEIRVSDLKRKRKAGITCTTEVTMPLDSVPAPEKYTRMGDGVLTALQQAARTCGTEDTQYLITCVHITPDLVEGFDNSRMLRVTAPTGFPSDVLIPATTVMLLEGLEITKVALADGWCHFKTAGGTEISARASNQPFVKNIDAVFRMNDESSLTLPSNLAEMIERAEVFHNGGFDATVGIRLADGELLITSRKEGGWYREKKRIKYEGRALAFDINPKFLVEVLKRTRDVLVDDRKLKIEIGGLQFVAGLKPKETSESDDAPAKAPPPTRAKRQDREKVASPVSDKAEFTEDDIPFNRAR